MALDFKLLGGNQAADGLARRQRRQSALDVEPPGAKKPPIGVFPAQVVAAGIEPAPVERQLVLDDAGPFIEVGLVLLLQAFGVP